MKAPLHQPHIPVVLCDLVERHPAFGNVCYKDSPAGEQYIDLYERMLARPLIKEDTISP